MKILLIENCCQCYFCQEDDNKTRLECRKTGKRLCWGDEEIETIPEWCPLEESTVPVTNQKIYKNYPLVDF